MRIWFIDNAFVDIDLEDVSEESKTFFIYDMMQRINFPPDNINYKNYENGPERKMKIFKGQ